MIRSFGEHGTLYTLVVFGTQRRKASDEEACHLLASNDLRFTGAGDAQNVKVA
jgi:hypothetical protein